MTHRIEKWKALRALLTRLIRAQTASEYALVHGKDGTWARKCGERDLIWEQTNTVARDALCL